MAIKKGDNSKKAIKPVAADEEEVKPYSIARVKEFIEEVRAEFRKIVWPDKKVTMGSTGVVILLVIIISLYLGAVDMLIGKIVTLVLR